MSVVINSMKDLMDSYDVFFMDMCGVIHHDDVLFEGIIDFFKLCSRIGKCIFLISNASRNEEILMNFLESLGLPKDLYNGALTAGMDCVNHLEKRELPFYNNLGNKYYKIGNNNKYCHWMLKDSAKYYRVEDINDADFIFLAGLENNCIEDVSGYKGIIEKGLQGNLPMVCANADLRVRANNRICICPGAIAEEYHRNGGNIFVHGKPKTEMFSDALQILQNRIGKTVDKNRCLMIGDSLNTDIIGANNFGIDSLFCCNGVYSFDFAKCKDFTDVKNTLGVLVSSEKEIPTYVIDEVRI